MKIAIYGKTPESKKEILKAIRKSGFSHDEKKPELVVSYGGDGTFLSAERKYPGIPKALFRYSKICKKCHNLPINHALELLKKRKYRIIAHHKLQARTKKTTLLAANDIVVRNALPTHALRFRIAVNGRKINGEFIGDGIVVATTFGSTGYFQSITRKSFKKGIGIAFNNTTVKQPPLFLSANSKIKLTVTRGEAFLVGDNEPRMVVMTPGKSVSISTSQKKTRIISF